MKPFVVIASSIGILCIVVLAAYPLIAEKRARSRVSIAGGGMRSLSTAIESYLVDRNSHSTKFPSAAVAPTSGTQGNITPISITLLPVPYVYDSSNGTRSQSAGGCNKQ